MFLISPNLVPFTVKDLKKHLEYIDDDVPIRLVSQETNKYLALVGRSNDEALFSFQDKEYFTGYDFINNCKR